MQRVDRVFALIEQPVSRLRDRHHDIVLLRQLPRGFRGVIALDDRPDLLHGLLRRHALPDQNTGAAVA